MRLAQKTTKFKVSVVPLAEGSTAEQFPNRLLDIRLYILKKMQFSYASVGTETSEPLLSLFFS